MIIKICVNHGEYEVPLISTFAFSHAEYWCPYCGYTSGIFGAGKNIESTDVLQKRRDMYFEMSQNYLTAKGREYAVATEHNGKMYRPPSTLPEEVKALDRKYIEEWRHNIKIEDVEKQPK